MKLEIVLALACMALFILLVLLSKNPRRLTILYILAAFPLMDLYISPQTMGGLKLFDGIVFLSGFLLFSKLITVNNKNPYFYVTIAFVLTLVIGSISSSFVANSLVSILPVLSMITFAKLLIDELKSLSNFAAEVIDYIKIASIGSLIFLCLQLIFGLDFTFYQELNPNINDSEGSRYPGFFSDTQKFAQFLSMTAFLFLITTQNHLLNKLNYAVLFMVIIAITFTGGRAALIGLGIGILVIFIFGERKYRNYVVMGGVIGIGLYLIFAQQLILFNRAEKFGDSLSFRLQIWQDAFAIFLQNPLLGIGTGNYQQYITIYAPHQYWVLLSGEIMYMDHPENGYLKLLTEYGLGGFALKLYIFFSILYYSISRYYHQASNFTILFITASIIGFAVSFITVYSLGDKRILTTVITLLSILMYFKSNPIDYFLCPIQKQRLGKG